MKRHYEALRRLASETLSKDQLPQIALLPTAHHNGLHPGLPFREKLSEYFTAHAWKTREILLGELADGERATERDELEEILASSHALFVLGGDTRYLLDTIRAGGLASVFRRYIDTGLVFGGSSAGLIWLAERCLSDSESFSTPSGWSFLMLEGLGILPFTVNVHENAGISEGVTPQLTRSEQFETAFRQFPGSIGLAVDEFVALEVRGGICTVRSFDEEAGAYFLLNEGEALKRRRIDRPFLLWDGEAIKEFIRDASGG